MTTLLFSDPCFGRHEVPPGHVEHAGRFDAVDKALSREEFKDLVRKAPPRVEKAAIDRVHGISYRDSVEAAAPQSGLVQLDADTFMGPTTLEASLKAAGGACAAVDALYAGEATNAFIASRPPGHHAETRSRHGLLCF